MFSKIGFLLNTTARILKLYQQYKRVDGVQKEVKMTKLTVSDIEAAEGFWILEAQTLSNRAVKEGKLVRLCPRYKDGVIVGGMARRWMQATWNKKEFILLPQEHRLSQLIALDEHAKSGHLGVASTVTRIR